MSANIAQSSRSVPQHDNPIVQSSNQVESFKLPVQPQNTFGETLIGQSQTMQFDDRKQMQQNKANFSYPVVSQDFHKSFPPSTGNRSNRPQSASDSEGLGLGSHLTSLSISDISRADTSTAHYVISEPDDPDSLQTMLRDVQKICSQNISDACAGVSRQGKVATRGNTNRLFGVKAWPNGPNGSVNQSEMSKTLEGAKIQSVPVAGKKATKTMHLRKSKGPLHSSPHSRKTKSVFNANKSQVPNTRTSKIGDHNMDNNNMDLHPNENEPTKDTDTKKPKLKTKSPLLPEQSPNVSTAISHYRETGEHLQEELFSQRGVAKLPAETPSVPGTRPQPQGRRKWQFVAEFS
jgi:hypothetical protein